MDRNLDDLYKGYFTKHNCSMMYQLLRTNHFSAFDAFLSSGDTSILVEYKRRTGRLADEMYNTIFIEKLKYVKLKIAGKLSEAPVFYINEYDDCALVFELNFNQPMQEEIRPMRKNNQSDEIKYKSIYNLNIYSASIIISKLNGGWNRRSPAKLKEYLDYNRN